MPATAAILPADAAGHERLGAALSLGIILNIFLPKGGLYLAGIPLTWGYLFLAPATTWGIITLFFNGTVTASRLITWLATIPFAGIAILTIASNGADSPQYTVALLVSFALLPLALLVAFDPFLPGGKLDRILGFVAKGLFYVAIWGVVGFVFTAITKIPLDIPFVTTGGGSELSSIDRNNWRGELYKLTSTFNNGNIYGICVLMALPIAAQFMPRWKTNIIKLSILLTLSRSAWAGLIFYEIGHAVFVQRRAGALKYLLIAMAVGTAMIAVLLVILQTDVSFLFDTSLGGRLHAYDMGEILPFSPNAFDMIYEIVYPGVLSNFGYMGLLTFLIAMTAPFFCRLVDPRPLDNLDRSIMLGMLTYLFICWADGAILLIPSMFFYWSLSTCLLAARRAAAPALATVPAAT